MGHTEAGTSQQGYSLQLGVAGSGDDPEDAPAAKRIRQLLDQA